ncbi:hypothetical protein C7M84_019711 [Penaeus vannamei]|uniref:Uncharacterized protein n=1 Tax=Penaeus vannamei TaxID=6689 RepID=A0A3R7P6I1_PENVA|nr:hypothetical protein C7M84_019711 [Penaeus vannamei]
MPTSRGLAHSRLYLLCLPPPRPHPPLCTLTSRSRSVQRSPQWTLFEREPHCSHALIPAPRSLPLSPSSNSPRSLPRLLLSIRACPSMLSRSPFSPHRLALHSQSLLSSISPRSSSLRFSRSLPSPSRPLSLPSTSISHSSTCPSSILLSPPPSSSSDLSAPLPPPHSSSSSLALPSPPPLISSSYLRPPPTSPLNHPLPSSICSFLDLSSSPPLPSSLLSISRASPSALLLFLLDLSSSPSLLIILSPPPSLFLDLSSSPSLSILLSLLLPSFLRSISLAALPSFPLLVSLLILASAPPSPPLPPLSSSIPRPRPPLLSLLLLSPSLSSVPATSASLCPHSPPPPSSRRPPSPLSLILLFPLPLSFFLFLPRLSRPSSPSPPPLPSSPSPPSLSTSSLQPRLLNCLHNVCRGIPSANEKFARIRSSHSPVIKLRFHILWLHSTHTSTFPVSCISISIYWAAIL